MQSIDDYGLASPRFFTVFASVNEASVGITDNSGAGLTCRLGKKEDGTAPPEKRAHLSPHSPWRYSHIAVSMLGTTNFSPR
jgi:hypothetical protein